MEPHVCCILDAGAQYAKVIDRRVRELQVHSVILPLDTPIETLKDFKAIIISGGPQSVYGKDAPAHDPRFSELDMPMLGICYGMQLLNFLAGGTVERQAIREDGQFDIKVVEEAASPLFDGISATTPVLLTHGDSVATFGEGYHVSAVTAGGHVAAIENSALRRFGVQFHPEVDLTKEGMAILRNFLLNIAQCPATYTLTSRRHRAVQYLRERVGDKPVLVLVSGGVDSSVCAALLREALGPEKVKALHIDPGFMRHEESKKVAVALKAIGIDLQTVSAWDVFSQATTTIDGKQTSRLCETVSPEVKRKIIGDTFMRVTEENVALFGLDTTCYLAQGTLRPDLIESASSIASTAGVADVIKTHHNDTQLCRNLRELGRIVEPLSDYHKDEVRVLGLELGLPESLVWRQPFPGPGLAIRIICADEPYTTPDDDKVCEHLSSLVEGFHATLLPCRTVGVQGDGRSYSAVVALTGKADWVSLFDVAKAIPKAVHGVNRVVYLFGEPLPHGGRLTSITPTFVNEESIKQLQAADDIVSSILVAYGLNRSLSQVPVILFPVDFGVAGARGVCIRTFITNDFMTGVPARPGIEMPVTALEEMVKRILDEVPGVARVCYDLTSKPPGTTEWE